MPPPPPYPLYQANSLHTPYKNGMLGKRGRLINCENYNKG